MANATARVPMATTPWGDDKIFRQPADVTKTFYPGMMIARNSSGLAVSCDDTSNISFDGINSATVNIFVTSGDGSSADIAHLIPVERPWRFVMQIAAAAAGDEGKKLYAVDDNHVGYSSVNSILVGWVDQVLSATLVLVNPLYAPLNPVAISNNVLAFAGATGVDQITIPDNLADALSVAQGANIYMTFVTTDGSELTKILGPAATGTTNTGGGVQVTGGIGGSASGAGGTVVIAGGAGTAGNAAGGLVSFTGGAGQGSAAGGAAGQTGGVGGATGVGGAASMIGGAGGATSGTGGACLITGGAGTNGNAVGGAVTIAAGAGQGTGAGAVAGMTGGASGAGATGNGGLCKIVGGAALSTNGTGGAAQVTGGVATGTGTGGAVTISSGASAGASGTAGNVTIDCGSAATGTAGTITIGGSNASSTSIGAALLVTGVVSPTAFAASADNLAIGNVAHVRVTTNNAGAQNLTGMTGGADGRIVYITNIGATDSVVLKHDATSTAANRFYGPNAADVTLRVKGSVWAMYDGTLSRWLIMGA